jgi:hypothetical protein
MGEQRQQVPPVQQEVKIRFSLTPVSALRYLSYAAAVVGLLYAIFGMAAAVGGDWKAAALFGGLLYTVFFSGLLYGLSCLVSSFSKKE